ncbi:MAG: putative toxin-antitoxin system toxin component, PIN family [Pseudomonadota bacterium]
MSVLPNSFALVIDTNIVLDLFVFNDEAAQPLRDLLLTGKLQWLATAPMRTELERVLGYPQIAPRVAFYKLTATDVLKQFDHHTRIVPPAPKSPITCSDPDDQLFIDLATAHRAPLITKDRDILSMKKRLLVHGVRTGRTLQDVTG